MAEHHQYMPILQSKRGEFEALRSLGMKQRASLLPVIDVVPPRWDFENDRPTRSVEEHVAEIAASLRSHWGPLHSVRVDGYLIDDPKLHHESAHPLDGLVQIARAYGIKMVPVTGLGRSASYQRLITEAHQTDRRGVTLRFEKEDLIHLDQLSSAIKELTESIKIDPSDADLVFDLKFISEADEAYHAERVASALEVLPYASEWRSLFIAASAFPENLSGIPSDSERNLPRVEWTLWKTIDENRRRFARSPWYSDYAVTHPIPVEIKAPRMSANLRYTGENGWLVFRGKHVGDHGFDQFNHLCTELVERDEFCGRNYSAGDRFFAKCAASEAGPGSATTWRFAGTSHHLEFVVRQLRQHFEKTRLPRRIDS